MSLGRKVLIVFAVLAVVALALLVWRVSSGLDESTRAQRAGETQPDPERSVPSLEPDNFTLDQSVIGMDLNDVESQLEEAGVPYKVEGIGGEELEDAIENLGIDPALAEAGEVIATDPPPGETLEPGETITLFVSEGLDGDDDKDDEHGPPEHSKGKDKNKEEEDD